MYLWNATNNKSSDYVVNFSVYRLSLSVWILHHLSLYSSIRWCHAQTVSLENMVLFLKFLCQWDISFQSMLFSKPVLTQLNMYKFLICGSVFCCWKTYDLLVVCVRKSSWAKLLCHIRIKRVCRWEQPSKKMLLNIQHETGPILGVLFVYLHSVESNIFYHMSVNASSLFIATSFKVGSLAHIY